MPIKPLRTIIFKQLDIDGTDPGHYWVELYSEYVKYDTKTLKESYGLYLFVDKDKDGKNDCKGEKNDAEMYKEDARRQGISSYIDNRPERRGWVIRPFVARDTIYDYYPDGKMQRKVEIIESGVFGVPQSGKDKVNFFADDRDSHIK